MSWLKKLFTVSTNSVNQTMNNAVESLVDIKREGNALISQLDRDINSLHSRVVEAQREIQLSSFEISKNAELIYNHTEVAKLAIKAGNDEDATYSLSRVEGLEMVSKTHQQTIDILQPIVDQQIEHINKMVSEKQLLKAEITRLDLEERQYKLRASLLGNTGNSGVEKGGIDINYLRERVMNARATCEAKEIVASKVTSTQVDNVQATPSNVKSRLEALKEEVKSS